MIVFYEWEESNAKGGRRIRFSVDASMKLVIPLGLITTAIGAWKYGLVGWLLNMLD